MVVTSDSRATQAALEVIQKGGNAVDALVTAQAVLNVTEPQSSGIGGAGFLLFYDSGTRRVLYFDGSARAPAKAYAKMFLGRDGPPAKQDEARPSSRGGTPLSYQERRVDGLAAGVPGTFKLLREVRLKYGSMKFPLGTLLDPAIGLAEKGSPVSEALAGALEEHRKELSLSPDAHGIFFRNGRALKAGEDLVQPDLAKTFRALQKDEPDLFYRDGIAKAIPRSFGPSSRGLLTGKDLARYGITRQAPLHGGYQGYELFTPGPPSSGGIMVLAACNILSEFDLTNLAGRPEGIHWVEETLKLAEPTGKTVGDPELFDLPVKYILAGAWAEKQAGRLNADKVFRLPDEQGLQPDKKRQRAESSILITDKSGSIVAYMGTLGGPFGSGVIVPGHGFFLNDLLNDFDTDPALLRDPDATNVPESSGRPKNSASMTLVFKEGKPVLALNAKDGKRSASVVLNMLVQWINFRTSCEDTVRAPRVLDRDGVMQMEKSFYDQDTARVRLELIGHKIEPQDSLGDGQAICSGPDSDKITGVSDPRGTGEAAGF